MTFLFCRITEEKKKGKRQEVKELGEGLCVKNIENIYLSVFIYKYTTRAVDMSLRI